MGISRGTRSSDSDDSVGNGIGNQNMGCSGGVIKRRHRQNKSMEY